MRLSPLALCVAFACVSAPAGHAGTTRLTDGVWYGKVSSVSATRRTLVLATACRLTTTGRWVKARRRAATVPLDERVGLTIYYRPNGDPAAGHGQSANLATVASVVNGRPSPDFPPGWTVTVARGAAVLVAEGSGIGGGPSCLTSAATRHYLES